MEILSVGIKTFLQIWAENGEDQGFERGWYFEKVRTKSVLAKGAQNPEPFLQVILRRKDIKFARLCGVFGRAVSVEWQYSFTYHMYQNTAKSFADQFLSDIVEYAPFNSRGRDYYANGCRDCIAVPLQKSIDRAMARSADSDHDAEDQHECIDAPAVPALGEQSSSFSGCFCNCFFRRRARLQAVQQDPVADTADSEQLEIRTRSLQPNV